ncbi:UNVERIFIED_CONTAM: putative mitochondrial protein [Sesamum radiatum]|uniref:Mitochondrial protein n=1 Tax=Sesamum radiatum TaxID=300843 RepID=A0AAW2RUH7_SESRA
MQTSMEPHTVREILDRACSNAAWTQAFPEARVRHMVSSYSDHSPLVVELRPVVQWCLSGSHKCCRFEAAWIQESGCEDIISRAWLPRGFSLDEKIAAVNARLSSWGRSFSRDVRDKIKELESVLVTEAMFTSSRPLSDDIQSGTEHLPSVVDSTMAEDLQRPYTESKVTKALFGRLIIDNVLLAFETNHFLHTHSKGRKHFMNLKLDISKAYDRVEWSFLRSVLESLSSLFRAAAERGTVPGVAICRGAPSISHLFFADDTMVFCPAKVSTVQHVRQLATILGLRLENKHKIYLGLPAVGFRSKRALFAALKDRIWKRIQGWHEKSLSQAGKAVLIQSVVQAIPSYAMSCFRLPTTLLLEFQSLAANFFWHDGDRRKIHLLAWNQICKSKLDGGLGFRNLEAFNLALFAKQLWRLLSRPDSLVCKVLKAKYFPHSHLFYARLGARPSFTWRSIMAAMELFRAGCRWRIGTGLSVNIWQDPWLPRTPLFRVISPKPRHCSLVHVSELILDDMRIWNAELISALFWPEDRELIVQIPLSFTGTTDLLVWHYSNNGIFSVRSAYHLALSLASPVGTSGDRWSRNTWRKKRLQQVVACCPFCDCIEETPIHTLLRCSFARQVVDFARNYLLAFSSHNPKNTLAVSVKKDSWSCPPTGWIKVNFDGNVLDGGRALGLGIIARDAVGSCLAWSSARLNRGGSAEVAEAFAAWEAICFAQKYQWHQVLLEGDCSSVLDKLSEARPDFSISSPDR